MEFAVILFVWLYLLINLLDIGLAGWLERKYLFYPTTKFICFCSFQENMKGFFPLPINTYLFLKIRRHTQTCLLWILNVDFEGLTPLFALLYARDLSKKEDPIVRPLVESGYSLRAAKQYSKRHREGRDPFKEEDDKI